MDQKRVHDFLLDIRNKMKVSIGSPGMVSGLMLKIYQCAFPAASIAVMVSASDFSSYTALWWVSNFGGVTGSDNLGSAGYT
ncbi:CASP-like protein 5B1 [Gossypium hirsutum]|uniref:CASP-like protein 5B1 n=1 Tax=Gossypium hirsutum TaxID=3635 RepID=A0ABM3C0U1_GOSHI|nr:CASP-like protein 5B1 [Gossypium hirsutum]XP_040972925.1 CASP-like protein 5B1 [Gossypium hirsutum]